MDQIALTPVKSIGNIQFYKYPYLDILIATRPSQAILDLWKIWQTRIKNQDDAASVLAVLSDRCRKFDLQVKVFVEHPDSLPEEHRLTPAILSLQKTGSVYSTPEIIPGQYSLQKLKKLFGMRNG